MFLKISFLMAACCCSINSFAQITDIEEKRPPTHRGRWPGLCGQTIDGIEYGYYIKNEQTKAVKDEEYGRFEITLYTTNKSGCTKIYSERVSVLSSESLNLLASFNCTNANGKRLTAKSGTVKARVFYLNAKVQEPTGPWPPAPVGGR